MKKKYSSQKRKNLENSSPQKTVDLVTFTEEIAKGALSGLRQFLATKSPLKMMKNAFYFTFKAFLVLKIYKFLSCIFGLI